MAAASCYVITVDKSPAGLTWYTHNFTYSLLARHDPAWLAVKYI